MTIPFGLPRGCLLLGVSLLAGCAGDWPLPLAAPTLSDQDVQGIAEPTAEDLRGTPPPSHATPLAGDAAGGGGPVQPALYVVPDSASGLDGSSAANSATRSSRSRPDARGMLTSSAPGVGMKLSAGPTDGQTGWTLTAGARIGETLVRWGHDAGWIVLWKVPVDWVAPSTTDFAGSFQRVAETIIGSLRASGADIHGVAYANHVVVVTASGGDGGRIP